MFFAFVKLFAWSPCNRQPGCAFSGLCVFNNFLWYTLGLLCEKCFPPGSWWQSYYRLSIQTLAMSLGFYTITWWHKVTSIKLAGFSEGCGDSRNPSVYITLLSERIKSYYFRAGAGFGGSCLHAFLNCCHLLNGGLGRELSGYILWYVTGFKSNHHTRRTEGCGRFWCTLWTVAVTAVSQAQRRDISPTWTRGTHREGDTAEFPAVLATVCQALNYCDAIFACWLAYMWT